MTEKEQRAARERLNRFDSHGMGSVTNDDLRLALDALDRVRARLDDFAGDEGELYIIDQVLTALDGGEPTKADTASREDGRG